MQRFNFDDGLSKVMSGKRKNKGRGHSNYSHHHHNNQTGYPIESDAESLTYSASSSQAGESTDSSSFDYGGIVTGHGNGNGTSHGGGGGGVSNYNRQNSGVDSLGYSDDDNDYDAECYQTYAHGATITGQPSDSYANDRRVYTKTSPSPKSITHQKSPVSTAGDFHATHNHNTSHHNHHNHHSSGGSSINNGSNGSCGTPSTPPPRHSSRKMTAQETEVWYQKWWMCGFTDALNLNQH